MNKFLLRVILIVLPVCILVALVNYIGDAANLFSADYEKKIAESLLQGKNVTNVQNCNERLLAKYLIQNNPTCPEVLILGSSRTLLINASNFEKQFFFNSSLSGATMEDLLAVFQLYDEKKCTPKKIIIGLDPWTLLSNTGLTRWATLNNEYYTLFDRLNNSNTAVHDDYLNSKFFQLLSPSYFQKSAKNCFSKLEPLVTVKKENDTFTRLADGSINYEIETRTASAALVEERTIHNLKAYCYGLDNARTLSPDHKKLFEKFIAYLKKENIEITFFLAPYHPKVYSFLSKSEKYRQVIESETYYIELGNRFQISLIGSFNPSSLGMDNTYFLDGMHCNEKGINKLLRLPGE